MSTPPPVPVIERWRTQLQIGSIRAASIEPTLATGRITRATGLVLHATGLRLPVAAACRIEIARGHDYWADAEVVGFDGNTLYLMPQADISGLPPGARVVPAEPAVQQAIPLPRKAELNGNAQPQLGRHLPVGNALLGRVVDGAGRPLDGLGPLVGAQLAPLAAQPINPLSRAPIDSVLDVGVRAINGLLTVGRGQRMGLFAGSGVGKSVLLGMMARYTRADVIVVGLIGERGREVKEFIEHNLGAEGLARAAVVAAPADVSPLLRLQGAAYATRLAEYFRDQGLDVLLIMDSLTRYAMAQREIALAIGEPPATKGYPPSVFAKLPALVERTGMGAPGPDGKAGSITAFYTVLAEGDDQQDPIADSARAILDGHVVLSRQLAEAGHYPAIDIEASISRAMTSLIPPQQFNLVRRFKQMLSRYQRNRDLISVGAYVAGADPQLDEAIARYPRLEAFLQQNIGESVSYADAQEILRATFALGDAHA
ncbi:flagellar protein export ATPase FliI [Bordetella trematum]|uniref:flagellar protein export ATPase FliI n=1 Tax=Bordetella trematum TaxID=123899 RepID=UPI000D88406A|nr:flagellar protein export ATPase FliI [Bordetella trematum]SPU50702.1 flagellum-specific ATP synthase [Bordetella trematum]VDH06946.1 Flagellum-specific ATP synthase [Bordetella trematum]